MWNTAWALVMTLALHDPGAASGAATRAHTPPPDRPIVELIPNLIKDAIALPSRTTLALASGGAAATYAISTSDQSLSDWAGRSGASRYTSVGSHAGEGVTQAAIAVGTYVAGLAARSPEATHLGSDFIRAQVLNGLMTAGLKAAVDRTRPNGGSHSFPSGHTSASFATAAVLQEHYGWKAGLPAFGLAGFIGWTRIRDQMHWPSDIISGATIGSIVGFTVTRGHRDYKWTVTPTPTPGGFAVFVTKNGSSRK